MLALAVGINEFGEYTGEGVGFTRCAAAASLLEEAAAGSFLSAGLLAFVADRGAVSAPFVAADVSVVSFGSAVLDCVAAGAAGACATTSLVAGSDAGAASVFFSFNTSLFPAGTTSKSCIVARSITIRVVGGSLW
jgi:hypothetical protein